MGKFKRGIMEVIMEVLKATFTYLILVCLISIPTYWLVKYAIVNCFGDIYGKELVETCVTVKHDHQSNLLKFKSLEKSINELRTEQKKTLYILEKLLDKIEHKDKGK